MPKTRVLIFSHDNKIGDAVILTSLLEPLKRKWPDGEVAVVSGKSNASIWQSSALVDRVFIIPSRNVLLRLLYAAWIGVRPYSLAIVTSGENQGRSFSLMRSAARLKKVLWVSTKTVGLPGDVGLVQDWDRQHYLDRCRAVAQWLNGAQEQVSIKLDLPAACVAFAREYWLQQQGPDAPARKRVLINAGASTAERRWSPQKLQLMAAAIVRESPHVSVHLLSQDEAHARQLREQLGAQAPAAAVKVVPPRAQVLDVAALVRSCDLLVSPDTFAVHFASAFHTPVVGVFASQLKVTTWGPLSQASASLITPGAIEQVDVDALARAVASVLSAAAVASDLQPRQATSR